MKELARILGCTEETARALVSYAAYAGSRVWDGLELDEYELRALRLMGRIQEEANLN